MSAQFGDYQIHVVTEIDHTHDVYDRVDGLVKDAWVAVRHTLCESFVFDGTDDGWDMISLDALLEHVQNHVCPSKED